MASSHDDTGPSSNQIRNRTRLVEKHPFSATPDAQCVPRSSLENAVKVIHIDYAQPPRSRITHWSQRQSQPSEIAIIHAGWVGTDKTRVEGFGESVGIPTDFRYVDEPRNLSQIGTELVQLLQENENTARHPVVYVDSLSLILQYASFGTVIRFIRECLDQFESHEVIGQFYINPTVHDPETVSELRGVIDSADT